MLTLFEPPAEVEAWAEKIVKDLIKKEVFPLKKEAQETCIKPLFANLSHSNATELGTILPVITAWEALGFPAYFV